jgi:membrane-associated phospholipid phosphatase
MLWVLERVDPQLDRVRALWPFAVLAVASALVFAWMCDVVGDHNGITSVDGPVALWFAAHRTLTEGHLGLLLAKAVSPAVVAGPVLLTALLLRRRGHRLESTLLAAATALAYGSGAIAKYAEHRARPLSPVNLAPESEPSFPSGHVLVIATVAFVVLGLAWRHLERTPRILALTAAVGVTLLVAADRLVVGAHWLTDVVGARSRAAVVVAVVLGAQHLLLSSER